MLRFHPMTQRQRGFSLVELLIVVATVGLLSAIAVPQIRQNMAVSRLHTSAAQFAGELNYARTIAVARNAIFEVDLTTNSYQIQDPADVDNPPRHRKSLERGIQFIRGAENILRFYPRGNADGGTVVAANEFGDLVTVTVAQSGMVEVSGFARGESQ